MGRKRYILLGFAVGVVALAVAGGVRWVKPGGMPVGQKKTTTKVIAWQPETARLIYQDKQGQEQQVVIRPLRPMVVVPVYEEGKFVKEELALTKEALRWQTAFCPGDELELTMGEGGVLTTVRNRGLRPCGK